MKIEQYTMVNGHIIQVKDMVVVFKYGQMVLVMKVIGKMIKRTLKEN